MYIIDTSAHTPAWNKKYILPSHVYASYGFYAPFASGNTGLEDDLSFFKKEWILYDRE
ncbi:hypothetical protein HY488_01280 [Candidatus Woesearchaeota archaeon]|nr:hypothetical protein [Candidatus Woesearchaeota archaeon]